MHHRHPPAAVSSPVLQGVYITFYTNTDDKDHDTWVNVTLYDSDNIPTADFDGLYSRDQTYHFRNNYDGRGSNDARSVKYSNIAKLTHFAHALQDAVPRTRFEYIQKHNKEVGPALVGVELTSKEDYKALINNMALYNVTYTELNKNDTLFGYLV